MPNCVKHAADLLIAALMQSNLNQRWLRSIVVGELPRGSALPFCDRNAAPQSLNGIVSGIPLTFTL